jgi:predicted ATPase
VSPARRAAAPRSGEPWLASVSRKPGAAWGSGHPFDVTTIAALETLSLDAPVTFFVGENGSGKSTLLEAIASAAQLPAVGRDEVSRDDSLAAARALGAALRLSWRTRTRRGFFLRAEDFFGYVRRLAALRHEMEDRLEAVDREYADASPLARTLARGPATASLGALEADYGAAGLDARSHGQAFLALFQRRLVPQGLYLLDEPETPLSPQNQLGLLALMHDAVQQGSQFVVATHAPVLLAYPGARILSFDAAPPALTAFGDLDHVRITRDVLTDPARWLHHILTPPTE